MSLEQAKAWLKNHSTQIPALSVNLQQIARLKEDEKHNARLARIAIRDPALALALLTRVNLHRGKGSGKDRVESPLAAISLLGDHVSHSLIENHPAAETSLDQKFQLLLYLQLIERSLHNETQAEQWARQQGFQQTEVIKVAALFRYLGELLCCSLDFDNYLAYIRDFDKLHDESGVFGFRFDELTETLCDTLNLPLLIVDSLPGKPHKSPVERLLFHCGQLCLYSESGWEDEQLLQTLETFAEVLQLSPERVSGMTHQFAVLAARDSYVEQAWTPASRLILSADSHWSSQFHQPVANRERKTGPVTPEASKADNKAEPTAPPAKTPPRPQPLQHALQAIRDLADKADSTQSALVNACLKGLNQDLKLARVCLLILSADNTQIQNRMSLGLEADSSFRQFSIALDRSGLLKILLQKPQAIWINRGNLEKYHKLLPPGMMASVMTDSFVAMSLFIGSRPIGIVYADQRQAAQPLDGESFAQFKHLISLTSKALTMKAKR